MTGSRHEPTPSPDDLDPTGVRALLANLPDPGPMPDDLVARIAQSLELEQQRRASGASGEATAHAVAGEAHPQSAPATDDAVVSLADERARRRPGRTVLWLGSAAAVAMIATVSVNQLFGDAGDSGLSAQVPSHHAGDDSDSAADAGGAPDSAADEAEPPAAAPTVGDEQEGSAAEGGDAGTEDSADGGALGALGDEWDDTDLLSLSGTATLSSGGWASEVETLLSATPEESLLDRIEATDCLEASSLAVEDAERVLLSDALWDGEEARLLIAESPDRGVAWVLTPDCGTILSGPASVGP